jgi:hypothetical protein
VIKDEEINGYGAVVSNDDEDEGSMITGPSVADRDGIGIKVNNEEQQDLPTLIQTLILREKWADWTGSCSTPPQHNAWKEQQEHQ